MASRTSSPSDLTAVRRADSADLDAIASLHWRSWLVTYGPLLSDEERALLTLDERRAYWRPLLSGGAPGTVVRVAVDDEGAVVGLVSSDLTSREVPSLHVDPSLHGRGLGRVLLEAALDDLRAAGCDSAWLTVLTTNVRARTFYEHLGWTLDGEPFRQRMEDRRELPEVELVRYRLAL